MRITSLFFPFIVLLAPALSFSQSKLVAVIDQQVKLIMEQGDIPGVSIVLIQGNRTSLKSYGYANLERKTPVSAGTLFQIGSCSKAFTAMAIAGLVQQQRLRWTDRITDYLPWFSAIHKGKAVPITIAQLLHHTSGIPWKSIARIPISHAPDALETTVRQISGLKLRHKPGTQYEYATINYDILALIAQVVTGQPFEQYIARQLFEPLQLTNTRMGEPVDSQLLATGYKIGFFKPRAYEAPVFKGNNAAGYIITDARDLSKWLQFQLGQSHPDLFPLANITHERDETVPLHGMSSYAMGWDVSLSGNGEIYHDGLNPNYTAHIILRPQQQLAVAVLANSNSSYTPVLCSNLMRLLANEKVEKQFTTDDNYDRSFSIISFGVGFYLLIVLGVLGLLLVHVTQGKRRYERLSAATARKAGITLLVLLPFLFGIYIFPKAFTDFNWRALIVWTPVSLVFMMAGILAAIALSYCTYLLGLLFPEPDKFKRNAPQILLLSVLSGLANIILITIITSALYSDMELQYLLFYYVLTLAVYILGRKYVETILVKLNTGLIYDLRMKMTNKIFATSYQRFEKIDRGRIYTALNDDINTLADSTNMFVVLVTSFFTAAGAFIYLGTIAFWATLLTVLLIVSISAIYYFVGKSTNVYFEQARDTQNTFMRLINGMIDGFKEISLHHVKKQEYKDDMALTAATYKNKIVTANIRFINAFLVGESLLVVLLGGVVFALPRLFPGIQFHTIMSFVIILLYLIGPVNGILTALPGIMRIRIAWNRIQQFIKDLPANMGTAVAATVKGNSISSLSLENVGFRYQGQADQQYFSIGPIDLMAKAGEIIFIIGANGSGKTTLAKLLTGLYEPDMGTILINGKPVKGADLGEYFSVVFSPVYLFEKLYSINTTERAEDIKRHLRLLNLDHKIDIVDGRYSTIDLSGGQRKRLALLQCYLEDAPIYLFDEWAADQDPAYRRYFYHVMLPEMKKMGKIVIAITHDDHYFDVADKVFKMNEGKLEIIAADSRTLLSAMNGTF